MLYKFQYKVTTNCTFHLRTLTVKSIRSEFLKYLGKDRLEAEHKELFKKSVHDIYAQYANKHREENGDQGERDVV